ncbi:hypothetical protein AAG570_006924 [Ranatra chinensis]|uniref:Uncharacterized protein n=1 Tax=Ranatra chinensis TaxID=642074 RepID=A0ABD0Z5Z8_9HEMI
MASKRRNMFHKNKTQETTEKGLPNSYRGIGEDLRWCSLGSARCSCQLVARVSSQSLEVASCAIASAEAQLAGVSKVSPRRGLVPPSATNSSRNSPLCVHITDTWCIDRLP